MQFNIGDRVRVVTTNGGLFSACNEGESGTVTRRRCSETVYVRFDNGDMDYGLNADLESLTVEAPVPQTVQDKLAQIEKLVAEIKQVLY